MWDWQETKQQRGLQKSAVRLRRHRTLSPIERPRHFSTLGTTETGRKKMVDTRHTLTQSGDWSGSSRPLSSPAHRALWSECPSEEDWHFRHFPVWVRTSWPNPRPRPSVLPNIYREMSANMAAGCWSGDQLWGSAEDLYGTAGFVASTGLKIWPARLSIAEGDEEEDRRTDWQTDWERLGRDM